MSRSWWKPLFPKSALARRTRRALRVEQLEDRLTPAPVVPAGFEVRTVLAGGALAGRHLAGMAVDPTTGNVFVASDTSTVTPPPGGPGPNATAFRLDKVTPAGGVTTVGNYTALQGFSNLNLERGPDGGIYYLSNTQVLRIDAGTGALTTFNSNTGMSAYRYGLEFDPAGNLILSPEAAPNQFYRIPAGTGNVFLGSYTTTNSDHGDEFGIQPNGDYVIYSDNSGGAGQVRRHVRLSTAGHVNGTNYPLTTMTGSDLVDLGGSVGESYVGSIGAIDPVTGGVYL